MIARNNIIPPGNRFCKPSAWAAFSYWRVPVRDLRALPIRENPRLQVLDFRLTRAPGMVSGRPRTYGHGTARLQGNAILAVCIVRDCGEWFLETELYAFDEAAGRRHAAADISPQLQADIFRALQRLQVAAEGRAYGRGSGRN